MQGWDEVQRKADELAATMLEGKRLAADFCAKARALQAACGDDRPCQAKHAARMPLQVRSMLAMAEAGEPDHRVRLRAQAWSLMRKLCREEGQ